MDEGLGLFAPRRFYRCPICGAVLDLSLIHISPRRLGFPRRLRGQGRRASHLPLSRPLPPPAPAKREPFPLAGGR